MIAFCVKVAMVGDMQRLNRLMRGETMEKERYALKQPQKLCATAYQFVGSQLLPQRQCPSYTVSALNLHGVCFKCNQQPLRSGCFLNDLMAKPSSHRSYRVSNKKRPCKRVHGLSHTHRALLDTFLFFRLTLLALCFLLHHGL